MANNKTEVISAFRGLNRQKTGDGGEFYVAQNVCADDYPCMSSIKSPKKIMPQDEDGNAITNIRAVVCPVDGYSHLFSGVAGTDFYYKGKKIPFFGDAEIPPEGKIEIVKMNGNIIICCYNNFGERATLYYNYNGYALDKRRLSGGYIIRLDCINFSHSKRTGRDFLPASASGSDFSKYRIKTDSKKHFSDVFVGDAIVICNLEAEIQPSSGYLYARETVIRESRYSPTEETDEVSCIVTSKVVDEDRYTSQIDYVAYNAEGEAVEAKDYCPYDITSEQRMSAYDHVGPIYRKAMPVMNSICVHNNRLWATNPNGEYIYASKLGDFREFNKFSGIASDSYYMGIGSNGGFCGIVSYKSYVIAFKEDCIHIISGSAPSSFTLTRTVEGIGCVDIRSCSQVNGYLYFLSREGFYRFDGITFENISGKLGKTYEKAIATGKGSKYYVYAADKDGKEEFLVFDAKNSMWHSIAGIDGVIGLFAHEGDVCAATDKELYVLEKEPCKEWKTESCEFFEKDSWGKAPNFLWIRAKIDKGKTVRVFTSEDGGEYKEHAPCKGTGKMRIYSVPVRWQNSKSHRIKLLGNGNSTIYSIEKETAAGGRRYKEF